MEQVPQWLLDSVAAAGMTAYAEELENSNKNGIQEAGSAGSTDSADTLH